MHPEIATALQQLAPATSREVYRPLGSLLEVADVRILYVVTDENLPIGQLEVRADGSHDRRLIVERVGLSRFSGGELYQPIGLFRQE